MLKKALALCLVTTLICGIFALSITSRQEQNASHEVGGTGLAQVELQTVSLVGSLNTDPTDDPESELAKIKADFERQVSDLKKQIAAAKTKAEKKAIFESADPVGQYIDNLVAFSEANKANPTGIKAALAAVERAGRGAKRDSAMKCLLGNFSGKLETKKIIDSLLEEFPSPQIESWIRLIINNTEGKTKAVALMEMDRYLGQMPYYSRALKNNPEIAKRMPKEQVDYLFNGRSKEQIDVQAADLQYLIDNFSDLKYRGRRTFGDQAKVELHDLMNLAVGRIAPEIVGKDFDQQDFALSDYRGKVVMLDFWGKWCPPCRRMYSHDQHLVNKLSGAPFALIGINTDRDFDEAREEIHDENLSWRHFWDGPKGTGGPIDTEWNITGWPTVYLIDAKGVIRYRGVLGEDLDRGLEELLAEMGHEVDLTREGATETIVPTRGNPKP